jgi:D-alanyl-D-alanine carboxypeptidase
MKIIAILIAFFFLSPGIKAQPFNTLLATMLQDTLNTYVSQIPNIKGMSASVYVPGQGIWNGATGISYAGNPVTTDMRMGIASNSKLFVSVIMLKLAENNIIRLTDSIKRWLPNYTHVNPNITIRQLLNHSSGISDPLFGPPWMDTINANPTRVFTPVEVLGWLGPPLFPAGTSWSYSNVNYIIAGMIAKSATGFSISRLIRDSILTPLNMDSTFYDVDEPASGTIAHRWWNTKDYHDTSRVGLNTAAGCSGPLFSTAAEMVQWYPALFNRQIINQASLNQLTAFIGTDNPAYQYGLGISREKTQNYVYWGHGGSTWGYKSKMMYDSCLDVSVFGIANSFPAGMDGVTFLLYRAVKNHIPGCSGPLSGTATVCRGTNNVTYTVPPIPGANSYAWTLPAGVTGNSNTNSITVNVGAGAVSGNMIVRGVNNYGPGGFSSLFVTVKPTPAAPVITQNGNTLTSNAPSGNQWYNASGIISGATGNTYTITAGGSYYCIVTLDGCSSAPSNTINAVVTGVTNIGNGSSWKVYPNPAAGFFFSETQGRPLMDATLTIYTLAGTLIKTERINQQQQQISVAALANGMYMVEIRSGLLKARQKLVVIR